MADENHLKILRSGVEAWNQWREKNPHIIPDLAGANLKDTNLKNDLVRANRLIADLSGADLSGADLSGANLSRADLSGADLGRADLSGADLSGADLSRAYLSGANLMNAKMNNTNLADAELARTDLRNADLSKSYLEYAYISDANLTNINLSDSNLTCATFGDNASLYKANLKNSRLSGISLRNADLREANLENAKLCSIKDYLWFDEGYEVDEKIELSGTDLSGADLSGVDLSGADFKGSKIDSETKIESKYRTIWKIVNNLDYEKDLSYLDLSSANFNGIDFRNCNFHCANLKYANLSGADLSEANLSGADLRKSILSKIKLSNTSLKNANLSGVNLSNVSLISANLKSTNLSNLDLSNRDLSNFDLKNTNLSFSNLSRIALLFSNLDGSTLTGSCIQDWNINSQTNLKDIKCDYIFLKRIYLKEENKWIFSDRRPHDPNRIFAPGEFTKLFQKALETVDLIFSDGIDWQAFLVSFNKLKIECESDELSINSFENKGDGTFVIRVNVPDGADKAGIEKYLKKQYQLEAKVESQERELANLYKVTELLAGRTITVNNQASGNIYNTKQAGIVHNQGDIKDNAKVGVVINEAAQQDLTQAAAEIQQLLEQLSKTNPTETFAQKGAIADMTIQEIENNPTLKQKIISSLKAMGIEAFMEAIDHPVVNVLRAGIEAYREQN